MKVLLFIISLALAALMVITLKIKQNNIPNPAYNPLPGYYVTAPPTGGVTQTSKYRDNEMRASVYNNYMENTFNLPHQPAPPKVMPR